MKTFNPTEPAVDRTRDDLVRLAARLWALPASRARRDEERRLVAEEIHASSLLAGARLEASEVRTLIERGQASGEHRLLDYLIVVGYADAASWIAEQPPLGDRRTRPFVKLDEIADLHERVCAPLGRPAGLRPRERNPWRTTSHAAFQDGMVPPPPWLVSFELTAFVERFAHGPAAGDLPGEWIASALERFTRIQPFSLANGRVGRLVANLLLRRWGLPPFAVAAREVERYRSALRKADSREFAPLAAMVTRSVTAGVARLISAADPDSALVRLREIALPKDRAAFYKAAQRGRLQTVRRGGELLTTRAWVDAYRAGRQREA